MKMEYSKSCLALIESFESCRTVAYRDTGGVWTIGYGHTYNVHEGDSMSVAEAERWLIFDIGYTVAFLNRVIRVPLTQEQFDALVDFVFNVGVGNFSESRLLQFLNVGNFAKAADEFSRWDKVGGAVVAGLLRRREAEKELFDAERTEG